MRQSGVGDLVAAGQVKLFQLGAILAKKNDSQGKCILCGDTFMDHEDDCPYRMAVDYCLDWCLRNNPDQELSVENHG